MIARSSPPRQLCRDGLGRTATAEGSRVLPQHRNRLRPLLTLVRPQVQEIATENVPDPRRFGYHKQKRLNVPVWACVTIALKSGL